MQGRIRARRLIAMLLLAVIMAFTILPWGFSKMPSEIPEFVIEWAEEHDVTVLEKIGEDLYRLSNGEALQILRPNPACAFTGEYTDDCTIPNTVRADDGNYNVAHASAGTATYNTMNIDQELDTGVYKIFRSGVVIDTTLILDDAQISSVSLWFKISALHGSTPFSLVVVSGADLQLPFVTADYGELLDDTVSRGSIPSSEMVDGAWNEIPLNVTGISEINVTGTTKFGLRTSRDILGLPPTGVNTERVAITCFAGSEPYLAVTYPIGYAPCVPTSLWTDNQTTPMINNPNPDFSAIACHLDDAETLTHAAIYLDDNVNFQTLIWNSSKMDVADFEEGQRSPPITFNSTTPLVWNTRYYWAIKFWDSDDDEGAWSQASYFDYGVLGGGIYDEEGEHFLFEPYEEDIYDKDMETGILGWDIFVSASEAMGFTAKGSGDSPQTFMALVMMILTVTFGFAVMVASGSTWLGIVAGMGMLGGGAVAGLVPVWLILIMGIIGMGGWYVFRHIGV